MREKILAILESDNETTAVKKSVCLAAIFIPIVFCFIDSTELHSLFITTDKEKVGLFSGFKNLIGK